MKSQNAHKQKNTYGVRRPNPYKALRLVKATNGGINASADVNFKERIFGRDSIEAAEDLIKIYPDLVKSIIVSIGYFQGAIENPLNEEEKGKIHHEFFDGNEQAAGVLRYDSIDATPLYVRLICSYCQIYGKDLLQETIKTKNGSTKTIEESLLEAITWTERKLVSSPLFLLEFKRIITPKIPWPDDKSAIVNDDKLLANHIENQVWTDSYTALIHESGELANHDMSIAPIEVQGIVYDALVLSSTLLKDKYPQESLRWEKRAHKLQQQTFSLFWDKKRKYFARAIDRDKNGKTRKISTPSAMPAELLDTMIFDNLPTVTRRVYIDGIISKIFSLDFLTDFGVRTRSLAYRDLVPYADYHGSLTSWVKETFDIAKGLRRQGFTRLAISLENRIINALILTGAHDEFFYIDPNGKLCLPRGHNKQVDLIVGTNIPESTQAWTISALISLRDVRNIPFIKRQSFIESIIIKIPVAVTLTSILPSGKRSIWAQSTEEKILKKIPKINTIKTIKDKKVWQKKIIYTRIDTNEGLRIEKEYFREKQR